MKNRFRTIRTAAFAAAVLAPSLFLASGLGAKDKEPVRRWDFASAKLDKNGIPEGWTRIDQ